MEIPNAPITIQSTSSTQSPRPTAPQASSLHPTNIPRLSNTDADILLPSFRDVLPLPLPDLPKLLPSSRSSGRRGFSFFDLHVLGQLRDAEEVVHTLWAQAFGLGDEEEDENEPARRVSGVSVKGVGYTGGGKRKGG
jgi:hypothetical protein